MNGNTIVIFILYLFDSLPGASLIVEDSEGRLPVHLSAMRDHVDCVTFFYKNGVDLQTACKQGRLPIHHAALFGGMRNRC